MEKFFFKKVELWVVLLIAILLVPLLIVWSVGAINYKIFPYAKMMEISEWIKGPDEGKDITLVQKVQEDFLGAENRTASFSDIVNASKLDMRVAEDPHGLLKDSTIKLEYYANRNPAYQGYYVFFTFLDMPDAKTGVIILSSDGVVDRVIPNTQSTRKSRLGHGGITDYGDVVFAAGDKVNVFDYCGNFKFTSSGKYHHKASGDEYGYWNWIGDEAVYTSYKTGKTEKSFSLLELVAANPESAVLEPRLIKKNIKNIGRWKYDDLKSGKINDLKLISFKDPFHPNDVDVLTKIQAKYFPQFNVGDLLLSFRSINAIVIIDPDTLKIKWFSQGQVSRQHDPDWSDNGKITIYDNRSHTYASKIVQIDPTTKESTTLVSGEKWPFFQYSEGMSDYIHPSSAVFTNIGEIVHISNNETIEFAITVTTDDGKLKYLRTPRFFTAERHQQMLASCE